MPSFAVAPFIYSLKSYFVRDLDTKAGYIANDGDEIEFHRANIISSRGKDEMNYLMLDIDDNAEVWPSTTPGHYHIVFKEPFNKRDFENVVETLHSAGIIARGNYNQYRTDGALYLRTPWVKKGMTDEDVLRRGAEALRVLDGVSGVVTVRFETRHGVLARPQREAGVRGQGARRNGHRCRWSGSPDGSPS